MRTDKEIKDKAFEELEKINQVDLDQLNEVKFEVSFQNLDGSIEHYAVFLERGFVEGKEGWIVRNIVYPDKLQKPENKEKGKIE